MKDIEFDEAAVVAAGDVGSQILSQFSNSTQDDHQHLCTVLGAMSQELKEQNIPLSAVAYFAATCSSLDRLAADPNSPIHTLDALLALLSLLMRRISNPILVKKSEFLYGLLGTKILMRSKEALSDKGVVSALKCVSRLLTVRENVSWGDVSLLYGCLTAQIADTRPKVRRQAQMSTRDVLQHFQRVQTVLSPASEGITNMLERSLLLAGGSNSNSTDAPKGAQEVLYVLEALKECLPYMFAKCTANILKYYKTLLELGQPLVTKKIIDSLNLVCLNPSKEFAVELLDLLCSLAHVASTNETSADNLTYISRLLGSGMVGVCTLKRDKCVVKLPAVFSALKDILGLEHEEAIRASAEALKKLIHSCIDESMIKEGEGSTEHTGFSSRKSSPTVIEKLCATTEGLLDYRFAQVWDISFQIVSAMFDKLGISSYYLMRGTMMSLSDMQKLPDEDFPFRKQLHECVGSALGAIGPELFLSLIPLNLDAEDQSEANVWLFPIMKHHIVGARLSFFCNTILPMIGPLQRKANQLEVAGHMFSSRMTKGLVYSLWSLFPSFCNYPLDTAESFRHLEEPLCRCLHEQSDVQGLLCSGLHLLIVQNKQLLETGNDTSDTDVNISTRRAMAHYTAEVAKANLSVLSSCAYNLLSSLARVFLKTSKDGGCLQSEISEIASISPHKVVSDMFMKCMKDLLKKTQLAEKLKASGKPMSQETDNSTSGLPLSHQRAQLLDLAVSFLPKLNTKEIGVLYIALQPMLQEDEGLIQKKAYKVLSIMLKSCDSFLSSTHLELLTLMVKVLPFCHFSAKRHRLECLYFLIVHISKSESEQVRSDIISSFLTEIILALKEANKKTRNRAYEMLVQIAHVYGDEDKGGKEEKLRQFFNMIAGGMAGETPHMISAAVKGLARLTYEFSELVSTAYNLLPSTYLLLQRKNKEIIKANLGLLKVLVAKSPAEGLHQHLKSMVQSLLNWPDNSKNHFKAKIKLLLEMLVKKCGMDAVKQVMPEEHMKLLTNIRKLNERKEKKLAGGSEESRSHISKATTSRLSRWNHTRIFSDFDDDTEGSDGEFASQNYSGRRSKASSLVDPTSLRSKRLHKAAKRLPDNLSDEMDDEPLDLLDRQKTRSSLRGKESLKRKADSDDEIELDDEGRLIINEEGTRKKKKPTEDVTTDARSRSGSVHSASSLKSMKHRKVSDPSKSYVGTEYASKKAGGDVKRKDKLEPYAYWALDRKMMSRRPEHRAAARKGMASVVKLTKRLEGRSVSNALSANSKKFKGKKKASDRKAN